MSERTETGPCRHCGVMTREGENGVNSLWIHTNGFYACAIAHEGETPYLAEPIPYENPPILIVTPAEQDPENVHNVVYPHYTMNGQILRTVKVGQFCWVPNVWNFWFTSSGGWTQEVFDALSQEFDKLREMKQEANMLAEVLPGGGDVNG